jgi:molybdopterin-guanine dinucleotide biosynthesis protein A
MPPLIDDINAFVVAGGKSRRFGRDKALFPVEGVPLIERVLSVLGEVFTDIAIIADDCGRFADFDIPCHPDIVKGWGPLGGILTALHHARPRGCFVVACDMPFLSSSLIRGMAQLMDGSDVVIPFLDGNFEALHAFYSPNCREAVLKAIDRGERRVVSFFDKVRVRRVEAGWIKPIADPARVFFNINYLDDLEKF